MLNSDLSGRRQWGLRVLITPQKDGRWRWGGPPKARPLVVGGTPVSGRAKAEPLTCYRLQKELGLEGWTSGPHAWE